MPAVESPVLSLYPPGIMSYQGPVIRERLLPELKLHPRSNIVEALLLFEKEERRAVLKFSLSILGCLKEARMYWWGKRMET